MKSRFLSSSFVALSFVALFAVTAPAADPQLMRLVMPDAKVVSGFDVNRIKTSPFGQFVLGMLPAEDKSFQAFVASTGFDPRRDLHEVVMASPGDPARKSGLMLVRGSFDSARLAELAKADGKTPEIYQGVNLFIEGTKGSGNAVALLDNSIVAVGDEQSVRAVIDRRGTGASLAPELSSKVNLVSRSQDFWVVSVVPVSSFAGQTHDKTVDGMLKGDLFRAIESSTVGIRFGSTIDVTAEATARSQQDATSLADVVKFLMNMAQLNATKGPIADLAAMLQGAQVRADANTVKLALSLAENDFENLVKLGRRVQR